jgi:uncharacterized protein
MKYLILLAVIVGAAWWMFGRRRTPPSRPSEPQAPKASPSGKAQPGEPQAMLACAHCGVHLPAGEAVNDAAGRPFCSEAHRLAGPR